MVELRDMDPHELSQLDGYTGLSKLLPAMADKQLALKRKAGTFTKDDGLTFAEWVACIDALLRRKTGLGFYDLPDWLHRDAYDAGCTVSDGLQQAMEEANGG